MKTLDERFMVYFGLLILCCMSSIFLGLAAALLSFIQIAAVIEFMYWLGVRVRTGNKHF